MFSLRAMALAAPLAALVAPAAHAAGVHQPLRSVVDAEVRAGWQRGKVTPADRADDATFLRRLSLDLIGTIPTHDEAKAFLADTDPKKRDKLIDRLLADARFAAHQADVWDLVLFGRNPPFPEATRRRDAFKAWLTEKFAKNEPADRWVRALLLAEEDGAELFYVQYRSRPEDAAEAVSRVFLGTQLQCARCHDHPFAEWKQRDFYGMAGFFVRLVVLDGPAGKGGVRRYRVGEKRTGEVLFSGSAKDQRPGKRGEPVAARFLGGPALDEPPLPKGFREAPPRGAKDLPKPDFSRKEKLAAWVVARENPYFARAVVNRVWGQFFGKGLVHPVDDLGARNEPSHPELLEQLTRQFVEHKYDLKWLIRELVSTQAYQLAARGGRDALPRWYERARVRPLTAEELLASIRTATNFDAAGDKLQGGTQEYFVRFFGAPTNGLGDFQGGLSEHLFFNNAGQLRDFFRPRPGSLAHALATSAEPWERRIDRLFLAVLTRPPTEAERQRFVAHFRSGGKAEPLIEEALWALVNTAEFRFNR